MVKIDLLEEQGEYGHYPFALYAEKEGKADMNALALGGDVAAAYRRVKHYRDSGYQKIFIALDFPKGGDLKKDFVAVFSVINNDAECIAIPYSPKSGRRYAIIEKSEHLTKLLSEFKASTTKPKPVELIIRENQEYYGGRILSWKDSDFNSYVITGPQAGRPNTPDVLIGRVVQVRLESGQFGSETVFLRHINSFTTHENQAYFRIPERFKEYLDDRFKDTELDKPNIEYTMNGEDPKTGFIIPSPVPEGESTPMRDVTASIKRSISKMGKS